jgi:hypothetical protein
LDNPAKQNSIRDFAGGRATEVLEVMKLYPSDDPMVLANQEPCFFVCQTDGATEHANQAVMQMLRQCVDKKINDWVAQLPAIEFAINSAQSTSAGYAPFFNIGLMPRSMIWDSARQSEYPCARNFAMQQELALMAAHDSSPGARVNQICLANRKQRIVPFEKGDLVYLSSKNIKFPKELTGKLIPEFIGPYKILEDFESESFKIDLPMHLKWKGVHDVFHASLLRMHIPNDCCLFPGQLDTQLGNTDGAEGKWAVDCIIEHAGSKADAMFEIRWKTGDVTWLPCYQGSHLTASQQCFDLLGIENVSQLSEGKLDGHRLAMLRNSLVILCQGFKPFIRDTDRGMMLSQSSPLHHLQQTTESLIHCSHPPSVTD